MPDTEKRKAEAETPIKAPRKKQRNPLPYKFKALDKKVYKLTGQQKAWCDIYLEEGANLTIASLETYKVTNKHLCKIPRKLLTDKEKKRRARAEDVAHQIGKENLGKLRIKKYIDKTLSDAGYTDEVVRLEHFKNIKQDRSLSAKNQAIDMYYKKKGGRYDADDRGYADEIEAFFEGVKKLMKSK